MTEEEREYLARCEPDILRQYERGDVRGPLEFLRANGSFIQRWMRENPERPEDRARREEIENDQRRYGGG